MQNILGDVLGKMMALDFARKEKEYKFEYIQPDAIIKYSPTIKSRGVFANKNYNIGDIIEIAPIIIMEHKDVRGVLFDYIFGYDEDKLSFIGGGYSSFYNHRDDPNGDWDTINREKIIIRAKDFIHAGEEIFISYGKNYFKDRGYFQVKADKPKVDKPKVVKPKVVKPKVELKVVEVKPEVIETKTKVKNVKPK